VQTAPVQVQCPVGVVINARLEGRKREKKKNNQSFDKMGDKDNIESWKKQNN
jgi:hypothetical protein